MMDTMDYPASTSGKDLAVFGPDSQFASSDGNSETMDLTIQKYEHQVAAIKYALNQSTIIAITDKQGRITFANDAFCRISQFSREELLGQNHRIINSGYHPPAFFKDLWSTIGQGRIWRGEIRNRAKDGHFYWVSTTIVPFRDMNGEVYQYVSIRHDITRQKEAEEQLYQLNQLLENKVRERTQELESVNQSLHAFSYMVSHDLKAPVRKNSAFSKILLKEYAERLDETGQDYLHRIDVNSEHMSQLIDDFLRLAGINYAQLKVGAVNLSEMARQVVEALREQEPERLVDMRIQPDLIVNGDISLLRILLEHLIGNAWKFTTHQKPAVIELGKAVDDPANPVFYVRDNGVGFDMKYADRLFKPFQRLHMFSEFPGTGIGLATSRQIVEKHQGRIWAESAINQGTTVSFSMPVAGPALPLRNTDSSDF
jgi:PAS domain S-box-containing protein